MKVSVSVAKARSLLNSLQAIHASVKQVKNGEHSAIILVPFQLSGVARQTLNENIAELLPILKAFDDAAEVMRNQANETLKPVIVAINEETADEDERQERTNKVKAESTAKLEEEFTEMLKREKEVDLTPFHPEQLNFATNAFDPIAVATLQMEGLIEAKGKKKG